MIFFYNKTVKLGQLVEEPITQLATELVFGHWIKMGLDYTIAIAEWPGNFQLTENSLLYLKLDENQQHKIYLLSSILGYWFKWTLITLGQLYDRGTQK